MGGMGGEWIRGWTRWISGEMQGRRAGFGMEMRIVAEWANSFVCT
jgi:hypothetical protein